MKTGDIPEKGGPMKRFFALAAVFLLLMGCKADGSVMECGDLSLSNTEFAYYYWSEFFYYKDVYGEYNSDVDLEKPLDQQMYDEDTTWQDHFIDQVLPMVEETTAMYLAAEAADFELPQDYADALEDIITNFEDAARVQEYKDLNAYLQSSYGKKANERTFRKYLTATHISSAYADHLYETTRPADAAVEAYFAEHADLYGEDGMEQARRDLHSELYNNAFLAAIAPYPCTVNRENIRITAPEGLYK